VKLKAEASVTLNDFAHTVGIPNLSSHTMLEKRIYAQLKETTKKFLMEQQMTEPHSP